jgi:hypothetical protein
LPSESKAPSILMSGQATAQRSSLTVNNGRYYVDTTVSAAQQSQAGAFQFTAFQPGQTYYTMLLFAKPTTRQTYQFYVGPGFNAATDVFMARADMSEAPVKFTRAASLPFSWPQPQYDATSGLLTVTVDMSFPQFQAEYNAAKQSKCAPASFCSWQPATNSCGSSLPTTDPLFAESNSVCSKWTAKDVDCPEGGCYAFGITLPAGFASGPKPNMPPPPVPFPNDAAWTQPFVTASSDVAGSQCFYPAPPQSGLRSKRVSTERERPAPDR